MIGPNESVVEIGAEMALFPRQSWMVGIEFLDSGDAMYKEHYLRAVAGVVRNSEGVFCPQLRHNVYSLSLGPPTVR